MYLDTEGNYKKTERYSLLEQFSVFPTQTLLSVFTIVVAHRSLKSILRVLDTGCDRQISCLLLKRFLSPKAAPRQCNMTKLFNTG